MSAKAKQIINSKPLPESTSCDGCKVRGECCRYLALYLQHMGQELVELLFARGVKFDPEQEMFLVPQRCQHLKRKRCNIHGNHPKICRDWNGEKEIGDQRFWVPPGCALARKK